MAPATSRAAGTGRRPRLRFGAAGVGVSAALLGVALAGCRDAPGPFESTDRGPAATGTLRLTFAAGDEHGPAWSPDGTRVLYASPGFEPFPLTDGLLLSVPVGGGAAASVLPDAQLGTLNPGVLAAPSMSHDGEVAYLRIARVLALEACSSEFAVVCDGAFATLAPMLLELRLVARRPGGGTDPATDPSVTLRPEGFTSAGTATLMTRRLRGLPYQRAYREDGIHTLRPSWHPSDRRLVFSDGLGLFTWSPGADPSPIPGTEHGYSPAWSPAGDWIAFTQEPPTDSTSVACTQSGGFGVFCEIELIVYETAGPMIALVRPDGSEIRVLGPGTEPAFGPGGTRVYFVAGDGIRSIDVNGQGSTLVPATAGGREPAVSPDGSTLAFTRRSDDGFDLWVTPLP